MNYYHISLLRRIQFLYIGVFNLNISICIFLDIIFIRTFTVESRECKRIETFVRVDYDYVVCTIFANVFNHSYICIYIYIYIYLFIYIFTYY